MTDTREFEFDSGEGAEEPDVAAVTQLQRQVWSKGDFARVAPIVQAVADRLVDTVDVLPDERVLDVACGGGNAAIAASRAFANVTGLDFVPALLERGRIRAAAEFLEVEFVEGDAQELPFADGSFDVVAAGTCASECLGNGGAAARAPRRRNHGAARRAPGERAAAAFARALPRVFPPLIRSDDRRLRANRPGPGR